MRLVYKSTGKTVKVGDHIRIRGSADECTITYFAPPHKPSSEGKISIDCEGTIHEYYVSVVGAHWIEREDRADW